MRNTTAVRQNDILAGRRMVLAAEYRTGTTGEGLASGFRAGGWAVHEIDSRLFFAPGGTVAGRAWSRLSRSSAIKNYNDAILEAVDQLRPQILVTVKGLYIHPATLDQVARMGVLTVNYYPDFHFDYAGLDLATLSRYSLFFTTKSFQLDFLRQHAGVNRANFLHHGYCDSVHVPHCAAMDERDYLADVTYIGNYSPNKEKWLHPLVRLLPALRLRILGYRWEKAQDDLIRSCAVGYGVIGDFYARAVQYSRINIAVHGECSKREGWHDLVSTRTFEIPACKGFMLHIDNSEVRGLFEPRREIDVFASEHELLEKVSFYLDNPDLRREMIERAYLRCVPAYGYNARAAAISEGIAVLPDEQGADALRSANNMCEPAAMPGQSG